MARITVEDCVRNIQNRFELVVMTAFRARQILSGAPVTVETDNDKVPVIALREIATNSVDFNDLHKGLVNKYRKHLPFSESFEEENEAFTAEPQSITISSNEESYDIEVDESDEENDEEEDHSGDSLVEDSSVPDEEV